MAACAIPREQWRAWLSRTAQNAAALTPLVSVQPAAVIQAWPVSREVSRSSSEGEQLIAPLV